MKTPAHSPAAETDLFGGSANTLPPSARRRVPTPSTPPRLPQQPSPGNRLGAETWLADVLRQAGARVENLLCGEMRGVLVTFADGTEWTFAAGMRPGLLHGLRTVDDDDLEEARAEGRDDGAGDAWEQAKKITREVADEAVDRTANLLLDRFHARQHLFRRPRVARYRHHRNHRDGRRRNLEWCRPNPLELNGSDRRDLEEGALEARWLHDA